MPKRWATLQYLSRYVFHTEITNNRILSPHNGQVTFSDRRHEDITPGSTVIVR
jgi:hypothetical protein